MLAIVFSGLYLVWAGGGRSGGKVRGRWGGGLFARLRCIFVWGKNWNLLLAHPAPLTCLPPTDQITTSVHKYDAKQGKNLFDAPRAHRSYKSKGSKSADPLGYYDPEPEPNGKSGKISKGSKLGSSKGSKPKKCTKGTVVDIAVGNDDFSTLVAALTAAGLVDALSGDGPFTVFAPTNEAFAALPKGVLEDLLLPKNIKTLQDILLYHVVEGFILSTDLESGVVETLNGDSFMIKVSKMGIKVNNANVIIADIIACNGVIHVIDQVLTPPS